MTRKRSTTPERSSAMIPKPTNELLNSPSCTSSPGTKSCQPDASVPKDVDTRENSGPKSSR